MLVITYAKENIHCIRCKCRILNRTSPFICKDVLNFYTKLITKIYICCTKIFIVLKNPDLPAFERSHSYIAILFSCKYLKCEKFYYTCYILQILLHYKKPMTVLFKVESSK